MNTQTLKTTLVNPAILDTAADDSEWSAWLEANADRLAEESEAADLAESYLRF